MFDLEEELDINRLDPPENVGPEPPQDRSARATAKQTHWTFLGERKSDKPKPSSRRKHIWKASQASGRR